MSCVCITGIDQKSISQIKSYLQLAGMRSAHRSLRTDFIDINSWHQKVIEANQIKYGAVQPVLAPGKLWDQVAGEIFVANINSNIWGWADTRSTWALNYWHAYDSSIYFILVCLSPEQMLTRAVSESEQDINVNELLRNWQHHHSELLRFYYRHPQRCLLIDSQDCVANPGRLIDRCVSNFGLTLDATSQFPEETEATDALASYLVRQVLKDMPEVDSVQREITASRIYLSEASADKVKSQILFTPAECINLYRDLCSRYNLQREMTASEVKKSDLCQGQLTALTAKQNILKMALLEKESVNTALSNELMQANEILQDNELLLSQLHDVQDELKGCRLLHKEALERQNIADNKLSEKEAENTALANELKQANDILQENELLLSQLHEVQEELEGYYIQHKEALERLAYLDIKLSKKEVENISLTDELKQANEILQNNELLLSQLHDVQEELKGCRLLNKEALERQNIADNKLSEKEAENTALANELKQANDILQENELLLSQLHEVQEELEGYYLQYKEVQQKFVASERRWQRMLRRRPDYWDFAAIKIIKIQQDQDVTVHWHIDNLDIGGRNIPHLRFKTQLEMGCTNILLTREFTSSGELIRWPSAVRQQSELVVSALADDNTGPIRAECALSLSSGDWNLVAALGRLLRNELSISSVLANVLQENLMPVLEGTDRLLEFIDTCPPVFRYDRVCLKKMQTNSDYEHLWLSFDNISFGSIHWPEFDFRISCANLSPQNFGNHPKLEFPASIDQHPLQAWFPESYDDFGAKLELRFALPDAMDIQVWTKLTDRDQALLTSLLSRLPAILGDLRDSGIDLVRGWNDWLNMIDHMRRILELRNSVSGDSKVDRMSSTNYSESKAALRLKSKRSR